MGGFINFIEFQELADWKVSIISPSTAWFQMVFFPTGLLCFICLLQSKRTTLQHTDTEHEKQTFTCEIQYV